MYLFLSLSVLTGLAEGEILSDAEVQKSALNVLINCVCGPVERVSCVLIFFCSFITCYIFLLLLLQLLGI